MDLEIPPTKEAPKYRRGGRLAAVVWPNED
jgi:hypothetical protein